MTRSYKVRGMTCGGCQRSVERVVKGIQGVERVEVDLATGEVVVHGPADAERIETAIRGAGFEVEAA